MPIAQPHMGGDGPLDEHLKGRQGQEVEFFYVHVPSHTVRSPAICWWCAAGHFGATKS